MIVKAFENKKSQSEAISEYWNIYNAIPDENLQYSGNSQGYVPVVRDCINMRVKRVTKALFPQNHQHVEGVTVDKKTPSVQLALLEHYIRKTQLAEVVRSDLVAGDVTGQWNLMIDWTSSERTISRLVRRNPIIEQIDGEDVEDMELRDPNSAEVEELDDETITEQMPEIIDFATEDLAVIPPTCNDLQRAQCVCVRLYLDEEGVKEKVDEDVFILPEGVDIKEFCKPDKAKERKRPAKKQTEDAGIRLEGTEPHRMIFCAYAALPYKAGDPKRESIIFFAGENQIIGIIKNPLWSGRRPLISAPIERIKGSFFGKSRVEPVKWTQWQLCDMHNMGQDSAMYSVLPVFATDPLHNPTWASLVIGIGAVWPIAPADIKRIDFGTLWKDADEKVSVMKRQIWESMGVNEMMAGVTPKGRKNNQMVGAMQMEASTEVTDMAKRYEDVVLNPLLEFLFEFDQQYRTKPITIEARGEFGYKAAIETIDPQQWGERYFFRWTGTEAMMTMQRMQQQIAFLNVLKGTPPQQLGGLKLDQAPVLRRMVETLYGPELGPLVLVDERERYAMDADLENEMLYNGFEIDVHPADDDAEHLRRHMFLANVSKDPAVGARVRAHNSKHLAQQQAKRQEQMAQQAPKGLPGTPGGLPGSPPAGPGVGGTPRPGGQPAPGGPHLVQNPPGAVPPDAMMGAMGRG